MSFRDFASIPRFKAAVTGTPQRLDESDVADKLRVKPLLGTRR